MWRHQVLYKPFQLAKMPGGVFETASVCLENQWKMTSTTIAEALYADAGVEADASTRTGQWAQLRYESSTILAGQNQIHDCLQLKRGCHPSLHYCNRELETDYSDEPVPRILARPYGLISVLCYRPVARFYADIRHNYRMEPK